MNEDNWAIVTGFVFGNWLPCDLSRGPYSFASHPFGRFAIIVTIFKYLKNYLITNII